MQRFYNHHGQPSARLDGDRSVHAPPTGIRHSLFMTLISPLLFSAPAVHLRSLHKIWVDKILRKHAYDLLVDKLNTEWQEFILFVSYIRFNTWIFTAQSDLKVNRVTQRQCSVSCYTECWRRAQATWALTCSAGFICFHFLQYWKHHPWLATDSAESHEDKGHSSWSRKASI